MLRLLELVSLVNKLHPKLNDARIKGRRYLTKRAAGDAGAWISELHRVQNVEELSAKFELRLFTPQRRHLGDFQVEIRSAGASESIPRQRAVRAQRGIGYARRASRAAERCYSCENRWVKVIVSRSRVERLRKLGVKQNERTQKIGSHQVRITSCRRTGTGSRAAAAGEYIKREA